MILMIGIWIWRINLIRGIMWRVSWIWMMISSSEIVRIEVIWQLRHIRCYLIWTWSLFLVNSSSWRLLVWRIMFKSARCIFTIHVLEALFTFLRWAIWSRSWLFLLLTMIGFVRVLEVTSGLFVAIFPISTWTFILFLVVPFFRCCFGYLIIFLFLRLWIWILLFVRMCKSAQTIFFFALRTQWARIFICNSHNSFLLLYI